MEIRDTNLFYHSNGSQYRVPPTDDNGVPLRWWRRRVAKPKAAIATVIELSPSGKHAICRLDTGEIIRKPIGNVPPQPLAVFLGLLLELENLDEKFGGPVVRIDVSRGQEEGCDPCLY